MARDDSSVTQPPHGPTPRQRPRTGREKPADRRLRPARAPKTEVQDEVDPPQRQVELEPTAVATPAEIPLPAGRFLNRELSWLDFNARVLTLAEDPTTPLLERAKFLAIFANNLDEFYMVRVAGLKRRLNAGLPMRGGDRVSLRNQLEMITERAADLVTR